MIEVNYNPDVLSCLANLSNDEVFTPPALANQILDQLPVELWSDKNATFLDPVCKSGVFLREIAKRLVVGLESEFPDVQERVNHIFTKQLFGIAITELTALLSRRSVYCSKSAESKFSICDKFSGAEGNIRFDQTAHKWEKGRCVFCSATQNEQSREEGLETHAYQFIHTPKPESIFQMKFDVIVGNPPYQLSDGGHGKSARPIYHQFVEQAKKLNPRYLSMIVPARWFAGGKGLDEFRETMLNDARLSKIVDYQNSADVFPGVDIAGGICYFLWERDSSGLCEFVTNSNGAENASVRKLNEFDILIRSGQAVPIIRKVQSANGLKGNYLSSRISSRKPFGLATNYTPHTKGTPCWFTQKVGLKYAAQEDITDNASLLNKWKLLIPPAPIAGQTDFSKPIRFYYDGNTRVAKPGEACSESWLVACAFDTEKEVHSFRSYLFTKTVRFLLLQTVISQHVTKENFRFVPDQEEYNRSFTDQMLVEEWGLAPDEWAFIDAKIGAIEPELDL